MTFTHDDIQQRLVEFLYGDLDGDARTAFDAHVAGCERCRAEVSAFERTRAAARAAVRAPLEDAVPARARARVLEEAARVAAERRAAASAAPAATGPTAADAPGARWLAWLRARWTFPTFATVAAMAGLLLARQTIFREARKPLGDAPVTIETPRTEAPAVAPGAAAAGGEEMKAARRELARLGAAASESEREQVKNDANGSADLAKGAGSASHGSKAKSAPVASFAAAPRPTIPAGTRRPGRSRGGDGFGSGAETGGPGRDDLDSLDSFAGVGRAPSEGGGIRGGASASAGKKSKKEVADVTDAPAAIPQKPSPKRDSIDDLLDGALSGRPAGHRSDKAEARPRDEAPEASAALDVPLAKQTSSPPARNAGAFAGRRARVQAAAEEADMESASGAGEEADELSRPAKSQLEDQSFARPPSARPLRKGQPPEPPRAAPAPPPAPVSRPTAAAAKAPAPPPQSIGGGPAEEKATVKKSRSSTGARSNAPAPAPAPASPSPEPISDIAPAAPSGAASQPAPDPVTAAVERAEKLMSARRWHEAAAAYRDLLNRYPRHAAVAAWRKRLAVARAAADADDAGGAFASPPPPR